MSIKLSLKLETFKKIYFKFLGNHNNNILGH